MRRAWPIAFVSLGAISAAALAASFLGSTKYELNGRSYSVPHKYEFERNFSIPWLAGVKGLDKEPDQSIWLLFPAGELTNGVQGYSRMFRGYSNEVEADMVVNVLGGKEAQEFPRHRKDEVN